MKRILSVLLICALLFALASCSPTSDDGAGDDEPPYIKNAGDIFSERDLSGEYDEDEVIEILLTGDGAVASGEGVTIDNSVVNLTRGGTYRVSGSLSDGYIRVTARDDEKVQIVLGGVSISASGGAPIQAEDADKVFITLEADTENTLSLTGELTGEDGVDGVIFSRCDLTLNGEGCLTVISPWAHGIVCKDELVIAGGSYDISAASHGIDANDSISLTASTIKIGAGKDGMHAEHSDDASLGFVYIKNGTFDIDAEGDGISAGAYLQIDDGSLDIVSGGGYINGEEHTSDGWGGFPARPGMGGGHGGMGGTSDTADNEDSTSIKGLKGGTGILINGGNLRIDSADDAIHSNKDIRIAGGRYTLSTGDDGIHADECLTVLGGEINILTSYEGLEALHIVVSGGITTLVATDDGLNAAGGVDGSGMGGMRPGEGFGASSGSSGSILVSGGELYITSSGDGMDANGTLEITGGFTTVTGPTSGDTATLDYDVSGSITGGTFIGTGASGMAQSFSQSEQGVFAVSIRSGIAAGTEILLTDKNGNEIIRHTPSLAFAVVIISTPEMVKGESYTIKIGTTSGTFEAS